MESTLKNGMEFQVNSKKGIYIEVVKKHGTKFKVNVKEENETGAYSVAGVLMSKADITKFDQVNREEKNKCIVLTEKERAVLMGVIDAGHDVASSEVHVEGFDQFQTAGYLSMLERKGLVEKQISGKKKTFSPLKKAHELKEILSTL